MAMIDELKAIQGLEGIAQIYDTVDGMEDALLNKDTYPTVQQSLQEGLNGTNTNATINTIINNYRSQRLTKETVVAQTAQIKEVFDKVIEEYDNPNEYKRQLMKDSFDTLFGLMQQAADLYFVEDVEICFQKIHENAQIPTYAHETDACADIYTPVDVDIPAKAQGFIVPTGLKMAIPTGWKLEFYPRSGVSHKTPLRISNTPGQIDSDYRDEVGVIFDNQSTKVQHFNAGDRIAQCAPVPVYKFHAKVVDDVNAIGQNRGGGFGSTGE